MNHSWGGDFFSQSIADSFQLACDAGVTMIVSAGNGARDIDVFPHWPASLDGPCIITVGSSTESEELSSFSNYGQLSVELLAPGSNILSLGSPPEGTESLKATTVETRTLSGTSMAAPQVTGAVALLLCEHPTWTWVEAIPALLAGVDVIPAAVNTVTGGRLNIAKALELAAVILPECGNGVCEEGEHLTCPENP